MQPRVVEAVVRLGESSPAGGVMLGEKSLVPGAGTIIGLHRLVVHFRL